LKRCVSLLAAASLIFGAGLAMAQQNVPLLSAKHPDAGP
jgi:hypothetical protein